MSKNEKEIPAAMPAHVSSGFLKIIRSLEMREKRQAESLEDTRVQLAALREQLGLK